MRSGSLPRFSSSGSARNVMCQRGVAVAAARRLSFSTLAAFDSESNSASRSSSLVTSPVIATESAAATGAAGAAAAGASPSATSCLNIACSAFALAGSKFRPFCVACIIARSTSTDCSSPSDICTVTCILPARSSSSSVSSVCVNDAMSLKPNMPAPPLIEWATRKMVLIVSASALPTFRRSRPASIESSASKLSSKNVAWN